MIDAKNYIAATRSDDAAVDDDQRIALTISDEAAVNDEQMLNNEATRSDEAAVEDDQRIALTISDEAAVDDEQMHHNDANKYIALTRSDDEQRHNNDGTTYEVASRRDAKQCTEVHHNTVHYEAAEDKLSIHDDELSQEYFMSNEFEVQSEEEEVLLEREHKERECTSDDLDSNAPIASLATKISTNAMKSIMIQVKQYILPLLEKLSKKSA